MRTAESMGSAGASVPFTDVMVWAEVIVAYIRTGTWPGGEGE
jgi:hypothetical protein